MDVRSPLPDDLKRALAAAANDPSLSAHPDPLDHLGFYRTDH